LTISDIRPGGCRFARNDGMDLPQPLYRRAPMFALLLGAGDAYLHCGSRESL
jgi:hypothetical protein